VSAIGEGYNEFCETPDGYISYLPKGRMNAIIVTDNRAKPSSAVPTDDEKIKLFGTIIAYAALIPQIAIRSSTSRYLLESKLDRNRASAVLQARW
jgi:hypothetical protein